MYWGLTALYLLRQQDKLNKQELLAWVMSCQKQDGGFGGSPRHDAHLLHTLSAIQVLALYDELDLVDPAQVAACEAGAHGRSDPAIYELWLTCVGSQMCQVCNRLMAPSLVMHLERWTPGACHLVCLSSGLCHVSIH